MKEVTVTWWSVCGIDNRGNKETLCIRETPVLWDGMERKYLRGSRWAEIKVAIIHLPCDGLTTLHKGTHVGTIASFLRESNKGDCNTFILLKSIDRIFLHFAAALLPFFFLVSGKYWMQLYLDGTRFRLVLTAVFKLSVFVCPQIFYI